MTNDQELVHGCLKGHASAQKQLYEKFAPGMLAVCYRYTKSVADAEDVLQEGFIKVFRNLHQYKAEGELGGWIRRIMVTTAINYLKKNERYQSELVFTDTGLHAIPATQPTLMLEARELADLIRQLPPGYQTIFNLYAVEGYNHVEIGQLLGIHEGTSRSQYARARALLIQWIEKNQVIKLRPMQNEFEKQVKQKLDEMQLHPSAHVWKNIQNEIRGKSDRRRILAWLLFAFLLLVGGGAAYYFSADTGKSISELPQQQENVVSGNPPVSPSQPIIEQNTRQEKSSDNNASIIEDVVKENKQEEKRTATLFREVQDQIALSKSNLEPAIAVDQPVLENTKQDKPSVSKPTTHPKDLSAGKVDILKDSIAAAPTISTDSLVVMVPEASTDSTLGVNSTASKTGKWKMGIRASVGLARLVNGIGSLDKVAYSNSPGSGSAPGMFPPSPVNDGIALGVGSFWEKPVSKKINLAVGIQYQLYSTSINTGRSVRRDTIIASGSNAVSLDRYYLNAAAPTNKYTNYYHFVSVPVSVQWQMFQKMPLRLETGIALQKLIATNALVFDPALQIYYKNNDALRKTQLMFNAGINYHPGKFSVGPYMQYGITNSLKASSGSHFFSAGLKAGMFLR